MLDQKCLIYVLFCWNLKCLCHIWNQRPRIRLILKFSLIIKIFKIETKNALLGYFWTGIWKQYCHIWNQHTRICQAAKSREKMKMPNFGTQNALFGYFQARILKNYCDILKSAPSNLPSCRILQKNENA